MMNSIRAFFSWQSDLPDKPTTSAIRQALRLTANTLESSKSLVLVLDEATRESSGAQYIPFLLAEKIRKSDIFVADITTVCRHPNGKSLPNPNVTYELGLAAAHLGWERIILLFNSSLAEMNNLPFDFDRHRITKFQVRDDAALLKSDINGLAKTLERALAQIILDDPKRPRDMEGESESVAKRRRDVQSLKTFLDCISTSYMDEHIDQLPKYINSFAMRMSDELTALMNSSAFHTFDDVLYARMGEVQQSLADTLAFDEHYRDGSHIHRLVFGTAGSGDIFTKEEELAYEKIKISRNNLRNGLSELIAHLRKNYHEIDLNETNKKFENRYMSDMRAINAEME